MANLSAETIQFLKINHYDSDDLSKPSLIEKWGRALSPFARACELGNLDICESLFADASAQKAATTADVRGFTPFIYAAINGHLHICKWLHHNTSPSTIDVPDKLLQTPLHWACSLGWLDLVKWIIAMLGPVQGARSMIALTKSGHSPVKLAAGNGHVETACWLIAMGALSVPVQYNRKQIKGGKEVITTDIVWKLSKQIAKKDIYLTISDTYIMDWCDKLISTNQGFMLFLVACYRSQYTSLRGCSLIGSKCNSGEGSVRSGRQSTPNSVSEVEGSDSSANDSEGDDNANSADNDGATMITKALSVTSDMPENHSAEVRLRSTTRKRKLLENGFGITTTENHPPKKCILGGGCMLHLLTSHQSRRSEQFATTNTTTAAISDGLSFEENENSISLSSEKFAGLSSSSSSSSSISREISNDLSIRPPKNLLSLSEANVSVADSSSSSSYPMKHAIYQGRSQPPSQIFKMIADFAGIAYGPALGSVRELKYMIQTDFR